MSEKTEWNEKTVYREIAEFLRNNTEYKVRVEGESPEPDLFFCDPSKSKSWNQLATLDIALYDENDEIVKIIEFEPNIKPKELFGIVLASAISSDCFKNRVDFYYIVPDDDKKVKRGNWLLDLMRPALKNYPNIIVKPIMGETQFKAEIGFITGK